MGADGQQNDHEPLTSLKEGSTDSGSVERYYDDWAATYDATLHAWDYRAPAEAARRLAERLRPGARVVDIGCGTGLFAEALAAHGDYALDGLDISAASLEVAAGRGRYGRLLRHDLQRLPLPLDDGSYDGAACVGVLTYIEEAADLLADMCRCVRRGGTIVFTQRSDRWEQRAFPTIIAEMEARGLWKSVAISDPQPYLPANSDFGDAIRVVHVVCEV